MHSIKPTIYFQFLSTIDMIDDELTNVMEVDFVIETLVGVLGYFGNDQIEKYDEVFALFMFLRSYNKNP